MLCVKTGSGSAEKWTGVSPCTTACNRHRCPVDCSGEWGRWSACSQECSNGTKTRVYHIAKGHMASSGKPRSDTPYVPPIYPAYTPYIPLMCLLYTPRTPPVYPLYTLQTPPMYPLYTTRTELVWPGYIPPAT